MNITLIKIAELEEPETNSEVIKCWFQLCRIYLLTPLNRPLTWLEVTMPQTEVTQFSSFPKPCSPFWDYWCYLSADGPDSQQKNVMLVLTSSQVKGKYSGLWIKIQPLWYWVMSAFDFVETWQNWAPPAYKWYWMNQSQRTRLFLFKRYLIPTSGCAWVAEFFQGLNIQQLLQSWGGLTF